MQSCGCGRRMESLQLISAAFQRVFKTCISLVIHTQTHRHYFLPVGLQFFFFFAVYVINNNHLSQVVSCDQYHVLCLVYLSCFFSLMMFDDFYFALGSQNHLCKYKRDYFSSDLYLLYVKIRISRAYFIFVYKQMKFHSTYMYIYIEN